MLNAASVPLFKANFASLLTPTAAGIIGKPSSAPNLNLFSSCLKASSLADPRSLLSNVEGKKSKPFISPKVPMSSAFIITAPVPSPPPTTKAANFCLPDN